MRGVTEIDPEMMVTDIVKSDYRTTDVFRKYGIEYCCGGRWPLDVACKSHGLDTNLVREELEQATRNISISNSLDFMNWNIEFLGSYIINVHHAYLKKVLPEIESMMKKLVEEHGKKYLYLPEVEKKIFQLQHGLLPHLHHEEEIIFPYISRLAHAYKNRESYAGLLVRTLRKPVQKIMLLEHERISGILRMIRELTGNYSVPEKACISHRVLFLKLKELDNDLVQHIYLEQNVLFPKTIAMEQELLNHKE